MALSKRDREILANMVFIRPPGRGKIDPRLIRKAVMAVHKRRLEEEAEAKAQKKAEANGHQHPGEAE